MNPRRRTARAWRLATLAAGAVGLSGGTVAQVVQPGRYEARLCVANPAGSPPVCGAALFTVDTAARASVLVSDIVYRLRLGPSHLEVVQMHGSMQVDEFTASYAWKGRALVFSDVEKDVRYELTPQSRAR